MDAHTDISKVYQERILKEICDFICQERQKFATRCEDRVSKKIKYLSEKNDKGEILPVEIDVFSFGVHLIDAEVFFGAALAESAFCKT